MFIFSGPEFSLQNGNEVVILIPSCSEPTFWGGGERVEMWWGHGEMDKNVEVKELEKSE